MSGRGAPQRRASSISAANQERLANLYDFGHELSLAETLRIMSDEEVLQILEQGGRLEESSYGGLSYGRFRILALRFYDKCKNFKILDHVTNAKERHVLRWEEYATH